MKVVVGIIYNDEQQVFVTKRQAGKHLAGLWEFPGGKIESGETELAALSRELSEELGITVKNAEFFMEHEEYYTDRTVCLRVWKVSDYDGKPYGREGQQGEWVSIDALETSFFPTANQDIIETLRCPR